MPRETGRGRQEGGGASLSVAQHLPAPAKRHDNERSRYNSAEFRCCRESRLVGLSSSWDRQRTGPLKAAVIGRGRWLHQIQDDAKSWLLREMVEAKPKTFSQVLESVGRM